MKKAITPTRMELFAFKKKLTTARKGHKLLKDKYEGLLKHFNDLKNETLLLREKLESALTKAQNLFLEAQCDKSDEYLSLLLITNVKSIEIDIKNKNIMGVKIPVFEFENTQINFESSPFGYFFNSPELFLAYNELKNTISDLIKLSELENTCILIAKEIEKTRRRVNALEYVLIPEYQEIIRYIRLHLEENERSTVTRLLKLKNSQSNQF